MFKRTFYVLMLLVLVLIVNVANGQSSVKINFQSRTQGSGEVPEGYLPDYGDVFDDRGNGWSYGWTVDKAASSRDRDIHADQRYDTLNALEMWNTGTGSWEIALPDGEYDVYIVGGDPGYRDQTNSYIIEGVEVLDPTPYPPGNNFDEYNVTVAVNDGRLTIAPVAGVGYVKICFLHIINVRVALPVSPANDSSWPSTSVNLEWLAGADAIHHDVYFGEDFDAVDEATPETPEIYRGRQSEEIYPATGTLLVEAGKTYYWRIDEFDGTDTWKGGVSKFTVQVLTAFNPQPIDSGLFIDPNVVLSWSRGAGATNHFIYFGDNRDDIRNATTDSPEFMASQDADATSWDPPGILQLNKTYYWRVDEQESDDIVHTGDVWNFTTTTHTVGGLKAQYFDNTEVSGEPILTRIDPQINFDWGTDAPDPNVPADGFSVRWTGAIEIPAGGEWTFWTHADDGVRLWVSGQQLVNVWGTSRPLEWDGGTITLNAGTYPIMMDYFEADIAGHIAVVSLAWEGPAIPVRQVIPAGALLPPLWALATNPVNGAVGVDQTPTLNWDAGDRAAEHDVYFGTDYDEVTNADTATPGVYRGRQALAETSYTPPEAPFEWGQTYYWRVDEINDVEVWKGAAWSFTVADFLTVDDFEDYNDYEPDRIFDAWIDGYGTTTNGSTIGYAEPDFAAGEHFVETGIVHSGSQSMPYFFDNDIKYSEAVLTLESGRDWTRENVETLSLWYRGNPTAFVEDPAGTYTMTASGADIWGTADEFRYAFKLLSGPGSITAKVESIENTDPWAKAGVMIRQDLEPGSKFGAVYITPENGCRFQGRLTIAGEATSDTDVATDEQIALTAPYWIRIERDDSDNITGYYSSDGTNWVPMSWNPQDIPMSQDVYIGLVVTSHNPDATCTAVFSNVQTTGTVSPQIWTQQAIGVEMPSNDSELMYIVLDDNAVLYHSEPDASLVTEWTEWRINLQEFADQGVDLTNVISIGIGFGEKNNPQAGGSGLVFFDDIRLYRPSEPEPQL